MDLTTRWKRQRRDRRHVRWLKAARAGSAPAFVQLYREVYDPVADYLAVRAPTAQDAEDLISTVFHRFLQNLERYDPQRGSVLAWLITMARHALIDHLRTMRPTLPVDDLAELLAGNTPDPLDRMIRTEQADRVRRVLAEQPADVREMFALHYGQGLCYREIGELVGMTVNAVKQRFSRVRRQLRARLQEDESQTRTTGGRATAPARATAHVRATEGEV
jgi:RNA polymerase sigma-70 factor (ECF subfamily)